MPGNAESIKGIGLSVTADASQIKKVFDEAIAGVQGKSVQINLTAVKDDSFDALFAELRKQRVSIDVALHPTRETVRQIRRDMRTALEREGGVPIPVTIKAPSQAQGRAIHRAIVQSIGTPVIPVILDPHWGGPRGPSAQGFSPRGSGGAPGGATGAQGPVRQAQTPQVTPQASTGSRGPVTGLSSRARSFERQEAESEAAWRERLLAARVTFLGRLDSRSEQTRTRANNALAAIGTQLGDETDRQFERRPTGKAGYPERVNAAGQRERGGPSVGPLPASGPTDWEQVARIFYQNQSARPLSRPLFLGQDNLQPQAGFNPALGRYQGGPLGRIISRTTFEEGRGHGVRGQRAQRSFLEPGLDLSEEDIEARRVKRVERVASGKDILPVEDLINKLKGLPFSFGKAFDEGIEKVKHGDLLGALGTHPTPEAPEGTGLRGALDQLLTRGRIPSGKPGSIPGVGPRTVARALDPKRDISRFIPQGENDEQRARREQREEQQAAYSLEVGAHQDLIAAIMESQADVTKTAKKKRPKRLKKGKHVADYPEDPLREDAGLAAENVVGLERQLEYARSTPTDVSNSALLGFLGAKGPPIDKTLAFPAPQRKRTNLSVLRAAAKRQAKAPLTPLEDLLPKDILEAKDIPGLEGILGGFERGRAVPSRNEGSFRSKGGISGLLAIEDTAPRKESRAEAKQSRLRAQANAELQTSLGREPAAIATTTGPVDQARIASLEKDLATARAHQADVNDRRRGERLTLSDEEEAPGVDPRKAGYKLHLGVGEGDHDAVAQALREMQATGEDLRFKSGRASGQTGKDFTVYTGSRTNTQRVAGLISKRVGPQLQSPRGTDVAADDERFAKNVWGRFDARDDEFHQYGSGGVPYTNAAMQDLSLSKPLGRSAKDVRALKQQAEAESRGLLAKRYGSYFTGEETPTEPEVAIGGAPPDFGGGAVFDQGGGGFSFPGGGIFGGDGGGPVQVEVINFPEGLENQGQVAAQGVLPAGADFEKFFSEMAEKFAAASTAAPAKGKTKAAATTSKKDQGPQLQASLQKQFQEGLRTGTLTQDDIDAIQAKGSVRSPQEILAGGPTSGAPTARDALEGLRLRIAESRQGLPIRSPAVSIAQSFAGPRRGRVTQRLSEATRLGTQVEGIERENEKLGDIFETQSRKLETINDLRTNGKKLTKDQLALEKSLPAEIDRTKASIQKNVTEQDKLLEKANKLSGLTAGEKISNLGRSFAGSIVGTLGYGAALGAVVGSLGAVAVAAAPVIDRLSGYAGATREATGAIADQTKASGGAVQATVAQAAAQAHLSQATYDTIKAALEQRGAVEAGNKAYEEQLKLVAAGRSVANQQKQANLPQGVDPNLFQTTGGINVLGVQTPFAGQRPYEELLRERLSTIPTETAARQGNPPTPFFHKPEYENTTEAQRLDLRQEALSATLGDLQEEFKGTGIEWVKSTDAMAASTDKATEALQNAGVQLTPGQLAEEGLSITKESAARSKADLQFGIAQAQKQSQTPSAGVLLESLSDRVIPATIFGIQQGLKNQLETFLPAQRGLRGLAQPLAPFGRSLLPLTNAGDEAGLSATGGLPQALRGKLNLPSQGQGGGVTGFGGQFGGVPEPAIDSFNRYRDEAQRAIDAVNAKAAQGEQVLADKLGVPPEAIAELRGLGQRIDEIGQQQSNLRLDLQYSQYNRQLFIARRTLGDIAGLVGRSGATQIGLLQHEELMLNRRTQQLSLQGQLLALQTGELQQQSSVLGQQANFLQLQLAQRQINFQRATAGFTAPGTTPEERAARIAEGKIEADYAQKQLNIQREQYGLQNKQIAINREQLGLQREAADLAQQQFQNQVALQDALNTRAYEDQLVAIQELQQAFATGIEIQALEELRNALIAQRDTAVEEISAQVDAGEQLVHTMSQFAQDIMTQSGDFAVGVVNQVETVFTGIADAFATSDLGQWLGLSITPGSRSGGAPPPPSNNPGDQDPDATFGGRQRAEGYLGTVRNATQMTVGEAGTEMVAVIRNPRPVLMSSGAMGGGTTFAPVLHISISGNNVRDDRDLDRLAAKVATRVEASLGATASRFGLRVSR